MYAIEQLSDEIARIVLPPPPDLPPPWGVARNVYVFKGAVPALLDTGLPGTGDALVHALASIGVAPEKVRKIALTSRSVSAYGNADRFPNATLWSPSPAQDRASLRASLTRVYDALRAHPDAPPAWKTAPVDAFLDRWCADEPRVELLEDGASLRLGAVTLDGLDCPGLLEPASAWYAPATGWLFGGPAFTLARRAVPSNASAWLDSIGRVSAISTKLLLPECGHLEPQPDRAFRAISLYVTNLRTNLQHVLDVPRSALDLAELDLGWLPDDLVRFGADVLRFDAVMREFFDAGVAHSSDDARAPLPRLTMGAGSGRVPLKPI